MNELQSYKLESSRFKSADDISNDASLDTIGLQTKMQWDLDSTNDREGYSPWPWYKCVRRSALWLIVWMVDKISKIFFIWLRRNSLSRHSNRRRDSRTQTRVHGLAGEKTALQNVVQLGLYFYISCHIQGWQSQKHITAYKIAAVSTRSREKCK